MDIYGKGQDLGEVICVYCKNKGIPYDDFVKALLKEPSLFAAGVCDGIGGNREFVDRRYK